MSDKSQHNDPQKLTGRPLAVLASLFERDLVTFARYHTHAYGVEDLPSSAQLTFFTSDFEYQLEVHHDDQPKMIGFWQPRRGVPGIPPPPRQLLHDGPLVEDTWCKILGAIVSRELIARAPQAA